jgi:hypothetical protein
VRNSGVPSAIVLAFVIAGLTAQTPAPPDTGSAAPVTLPTKPLRSLQYNFSVDYQQNGEGHTGDIGTGGSGVRSALNGIGRTGVLSADVMGMAKDGALVIRVSEWLQEQPRPSQSYLCAAYPNGSVVCPEQLDVTDAENELMTFLGRGFYDATLVDAQHQWTRAYSNKNVSVASTFTITGAPDANPLTITEATEITSQTGAFHNWKDNARLTYDPDLEVPIKIHDLALQQGRGNTSVQTTMDFQLTKDSFAKPAAPTH